MGLHLGISGIWSIPRKAFEHRTQGIRLVCSPLMVEVEEPVEVEFVTDTGSYVYVCEECGCELTEIPYYNRFYCANCGLHY
jgi:protein-arginine kinase activator protein McsA